MNRIIKDMAAQIDYLLYQYRIKKCSIQVMSMEETIRELQNSGKSIVRFGDGEITMIRGRSLQLQKVNSEIIEGLKRILGCQWEGLMVAIPDIFGSLSIYRKETRQFWKDHLLFSRKIYEKYCQKREPYYNSIISRFYYPMQDKSKCGDWIQEIRKIWKDKDVVVVEGERTHNGVGNDLLDTAASVERIIGPASNAYGKLEEILKYCRTYPKDRLFLLSLGVAAKFLAEQLFLDGYRVLDIGNLDMEYEWFLCRAKGKQPLAKHEIIGIEANQKAGYDLYLRQIRQRIV